VGSGLILLVIVGAWLVVLVPMALRSHDSASAVGTVDKFHDAMRVLSRRDALARIGSATVAGRGGDRERKATAAPTLSVEARRRRVLLVLGGTAIALLVGAVVGPAWLLVAHLLVDLLIAAYVAHLRQQALQRRERAGRVARPRAEREPLPSARAAAVAEPVRTARRSPRFDVPAHVAGVPVRMPARVTIDPLALPLGTRPEQAPPAPARGAQGAPWQPVPVPVPMYVTAPKAPRQVFGISRAAACTGDPAGEREGTADGRGFEVVERKRAVNDW